MVQIPPPAEDGHADDDHVSADAKRRRDLREEDKPQECGEDDLRVIKDADLSGRRELIRGGDRELRDRREDTCGDQAQELPGLHHLEVEDHERQRKQAGKEREAQNNDRGPLFSLSEKAYERIGDTGTGAAPDSG